MPNTPVHSSVASLMPIARSGNPSQFLDIAVDPVTKHQLNRAVLGAIRGGRRTIIANHNLHSLYLVHKKAAFRNFYKLADVVHADGISIVLLSALSGRPLRKEHRTTYVDWMPDLIAMAAANHWRRFYIGSKPGVAAWGAANLVRQWPHLQIATQHGYFDATRTSRGNQQLLRRIHKWQPHIVLVGMGMPRQECWIAENLSDLDCNVILAAGAAIDYIAGAVAAPPRWAGRMGLEWLFRLVNEPKRLAHRYLIEPWYIAALIVSHFRVVAMARLGFSLL